VTDPTSSTSGNIVGTTNGAGAATAASTSSDNFGAGMGKDTFLKLLVAQLKYQNPLQPADGAQYMAQMAQFTQVEKLADLQQSQTSLLSWQRTVAGQGMIGKDITATLSATGESVTGHVTGLKLTDAGPRLVLSTGATVSVDEVTDVNEESGPSSASAATTSTSASGSGGSATGGAAATSTGSTTGTPGSTTGTSGTTAST
jgi:flagellar basal-body rod modification protein FlgD